MPPDPFDGFNRCRHLHSINRTVQPEILDSLAPGDPAITANRRDIRVLNHLMGTFRWFERLFRHPPFRQTACLELGAGDGTLARRLSRHTAVYHALDPAPRPPDLSATILWHQAALPEFDAFAQTPTVIGNLIFHQFGDAALREIGNALREKGVRRLAVNEPCRRALHRGQLMAARYLGFHPVSMHDGRVSIEAGFRGDELPRLLGLDAANWRWRVRETFFGGYRMDAYRQ